MTEIKYRSDVTVTLEQSMGSDEMVARAARVSTGKDRLDQGKIEGLINYLVREHHTSPLESCVFTVRVEAPISLTRQWERHRTQSYSEQSMRFSMAKPQFYIPSADRPLHNEGSGAHPKLVEHQEQRDVHRALWKRRKTFYQWSWDQYIWEIEQGIAEEVARDVLPVGAYTSFYATANLNNWFRFLTLRAGYTGAPQSEIQMAAQQVEKIVEQLYPITYKAWHKTQQ